MNRLHILSGAFSWESRRWHSLARASVVIIALAILTAYISTRQFATTGQVDITATMGAFSQPLVEAGTAVTSTLTAGEPYNYRDPPVPAPDEGSLVPTYTWSVGPVKVASASGGPFRLAQLGTDYTVAPLPPSSVPVSILTFTPKIAGYWQVSVNCGVSVKDNKTGQLWGGSAPAGPEDFTSYILHIMYNGNIADGQTENVCVGEQIPLAADVQPTDLAFKWNVMGTTVSKYAPTDAASNLTPVSAADLKASPLTFYWVLPPQSNDDDVALQLDGGPSVFSTFDVYQPSQRWFNTYYGGGTYVNTEYKPGIWLYFGTATGGAGVDFLTAPELYPSQFGGNVDCVQTIGADSVVVSQYEGILLGDQTWQAAMPPGFPPVLDTYFTYTQNTGLYGNIAGVLYMNDSPGTPCSASPVHRPGGNGDSPYYESFLIGATMYLIYKPNLPNAIWVPLDSAQWGWFGAAQKSDITGKWSVQNGNNTPNPPQEVAPAGEPTWNSNITEYDNAWVQP